MYANAAGTVPGGPRKGVFILRRVQDTPKADMPVQLGGESAVWPEK